MPDSKKEEFETMRTPFIAALCFLMTCSICYGANVSGPKSLYLTVYNSDFALVRDNRSITFSKGINSIEVADVSAMIDATSVLFKSLTAPNSVAILEQNYQYDLISPENILNKSVGETAEFTIFDENGQPHTSKGTILNPPKNGGMVIKDEKGNITLYPSGQVSLAKMPEGLKPIPTLNWLIDSTREGVQDCEISYITNGINWKADYVALVSRNDNKLDLAGWVTLTNNSGTTYPDAKLTLMAGDVRRLEDRKPRYKDMYEMAGAIPSVAQFQEKSFFEYHMYTLNRPTTIRDKESKQISLLNASEVPVKKEYIYDGRGDWWRSWWYEGRNEHPGGGYDTSNYHKVNVILEVKKL